MATHFGFGALAVFWFFSGFEAYCMARKRDILAHRNWMIRNFALSLAAVTLRIYLPLLLLLHCSFRHAYITVSWLCWVPNLLVAEWLVRRRFLSKKRSLRFNRFIAEGGKGPYPEMD